MGEEDLKRYSDKNNQAAWQLTSSDDEGWPYNKLVHS